MRIFESHRKEYFDKYWQSNKHGIMKQRVARRTETRREIIKFFGEKCGVCGFNNVKALQIDHKIGGGTKEMKQMKGEYFFRIYKKMLLDPKEFSKKYQLLCANCNWLKRYKNNEVKVSKYK
ncbi:MAG: hypothetical protein A2934_03205 [Candidatus Sungbacteria bacterium RIFCSPLOWO2_01_FULL_47_10]|uniref:Uncharacterized protein n=1 Tax=Candidatus Sungbacteria bacterium RIFCSPLOWO2_01_FULL_47_10 TaxID=1802276 RepID=A0A1G2L6J1_9BACT|nr:MAG: hypothetical protein A2934_03205 [Candidatus Sungbacteria bacterium RIFCSPLOWO2_01_FULL_47_10]